MGQVHNWATHFWPGTVIFDAEPAPAPDAPPLEVPRFKWIHACNEGLYEGHHQGPFEMTRAVFEAFVRNFRAHPQFKAGALTLHDGQAYNGGIEPVLQFDYEHASECPPWEGTIPGSGAPACAWALDVAIRNRPDGKASLWVFADLLDDLRAQIAARKQRWVSIAFTLTGVHWITRAPLGPMLTSVAITNHPFMLDLEPLAASNRRTSQPAKGAVRSSGDSSEAPGDGREPTRTGANMDDKLRERVCRALKIRIAADDAEVGAAVEEAVTGGGSLKSLLEALGVPKVDDAMKAIPELRAAREKLAGLLGELDALMQQEAATDAGIATADVAAAMKAGNLAGDGASKAMLAYRAHIIAEETRKLGDSPKLSQLREARKSGRTRFLTEYGVKSLDHQALSTPLISGPGGVQLEPPKPGGKVLSIDQRAEGERPVVDLRSVPGANPTLRLAAHLSKTDPSFSKLPYAKQIQRASEYRKTVDLTLE